MLYLGLLVLCLVYIGYLYKVYSYWRRRGVPGPIPIPLLGNYAPVLFKIKTEKQLIEELYRRYADEKCFGVFNGTTPVLIIKDTGMIQRVLSTDFDVFCDRHVVASAKVFDKAFFPMPGGQRWLMGRTLVARSFTKQNVNKTIPYLKQTMDKFTKELMDSKNTVDREICTLIGLFVGRIMFLIVTGKDLKQRHLEEFHAMKVKVVNLAESEFLQTFECTFPIFTPVAKVFGVYILRQALKQYRDLIDPEIKKYKNATEESEFKSVLNNAVQTTEKGTFEFEVQDKTIALNFDKNDMYQLTINLLFGSDSTSIMINTVIYELSKHQDVQEKCYAEITNICKDSEADLTWDIIGELKYLNMVIDESMRLHVLSNYYERVCQSKYVFPGTKFTIDKGVVVMIPINAMHYDPNFYEDPHEFNPERFSTENKSKIPFYAYLPFSAGKRDCVAKLVARLVVNFILASLIRKFKILPSQYQDKVLKMDTALRTNVPVDIWVKFQRRT